MSAEEERKAKAEAALIAAKEAEEAALAAQLRAAEPVVEEYTVNPFTGRRTKKVILTTPSGT